MTSSFILELKNVSKAYRLYGKPSDRLKELFLRRSYHRDFVALKNISLSLRKGESLGIIGDNGAGKSTLLQIIAGTLTPSSGVVEVKGKVLAILELGIGFHPELTGRENVFQYGHILGYDRTYLEERFPSIEAFAELGQFIDQPLKTYSSGMLMRLAFSVVASLEPEIMIIDEALAVGDVYFQKKCIDYIMDFRKSGGTLLFCSHALYQVTRVSDRVIWIKNGEIWMDGDPEEVVSAYEWELLERERRKTEHLETHERFETKALIKIVEFSIENHSPLRRGSDLVFHIKTEASSDKIPYHLAISIKAPTGWGIYVAATHFDGMEPLRGSRTITLHFPKVQIIGGHYYAHARVLDDEGLMLYDEKRINSFYLEKIHGEIGSCYLEHIWKVS
ncbi:MAG: polysaccharide ABC transporter ATP-binding protein [Syntrophobacterales bacterium]|nr:polysaccharide ABC transporter ATP-binding protein [Syntrophobacterales bacterium]